MRRLLGLKDLVHDTIEKTTDLVEATHESVTRKQMRLLSLIEPLGDAARVVEGASRFTAGAIYETIRATNRGIRLLEDAGIALARAAAEEAGVDDLVAENVDTLLDRPLWAGASGKPSFWLDHAQGALNAAFGDFLHERSNGLAIDMELRHDSAGLSVERDVLEAVLPRATSKLCIFVHGLGCTEWAWKFLAEEFHGDAGTNFGTLLAKDLGYTPLYVRYNTGLHVSDNGKKLSELVERIVAEYPGDVTEIVVVGHSMGGLVARSAAHYARESSASWIARLTHVFCIGSPHLGAPLEKAGNVLASLLAAFDTPGTQVPAKILNARSSGIKDLRFGYVLEDDWKDKDPDAFLKDNRNDVPFVDWVLYCFIGSTLTQDPNHPVGQLIGDVMVRLPSSLGMAPEPNRSIQFHFGRVVGGAHHLALMNHPEVYAEIFRRLAEPLPARPLLAGSQPA
jgi:pimeloyl-ACP methyl ester carboxylesterase